jgi:hypothetical protein
LRCTRFAFSPQKKIHEVSLSLSLSLSLYFNGMNLQNDRLLKCGWMLHGRKVQSHQLCAQHILSLTMKMEILENKHQKRYATYTKCIHT